MATLGGERRWKRVALLSVVGLALVGGISAAGVYALGANDVALLAKDWADVQSCMLGGPLAAGESASERVRKLKLATVGMDAATRPQRGGAPWPATCGAAAGSVGLHGHAAEKGKDELTAAANALAKAVAVPGDLKKPVDALWKAAEAAGLKGGPGAPDATTPKVPELQLPGWGAGAKFLGAEVLSLGVLNQEPATGTALRLVVDERTIPSGPVVCTALEADSALGCARVPTELASQSPGLRLLGSSDPGAAPFLFTGDRGANGVYRGDAKPALTGATVYGASVGNGGKARLLARKAGAKSLSILEQAAAGATPTEVAQLGSPLIDNLNDATLAYDWLVYWSGKSPGGPPASHLFARLLSDSSQPVDLGELPDSAPPAASTAPHFSACSAGDTLAVRVRGAKGDYVTLFGGGKWSAPMATPAALRGGALSCRAGEAWLTKLTHSDGSGPDHVMLEAAKCAGTGCSVAAHASLFDMEHGDAQALPVARESVALAAIDGNLLAVWNAGAGGVRARFAAPDKLAATPDTLINADVDPQSGDPLALDVALFPATRFAVATIRTTTSTAALRVDAAGKITAMPTAFK